ncbi:hypothetical protein SELMODRAFT_26969, partial [Selaginella moellendorffii]
MIAACVREDRPLQALELWEEMEDRGIVADKFIVTSLVAACTKLQALEEGRRLHEHLIITGFRTDIPLETALLQMYAKCGSLDDAKRVFEGMKARNVRSYTAMISAYVQAGEHAEALELFSRMSKVEAIEPNAYTFATILGAVEGLGNLEKGRKVHRHLASRGFDTNVVVQNALVTMYGKCGSPVEARKVFDSMTARNVISWTSMI